MATGAAPWNRDGFGLQNLEAPFSADGDIVRALKHVQNQERSHAKGAYGGGAISSWKYRSAGSASGRHRVSPPGQNDTIVEIPGPPGTFRPGAFVMVGQDRNGAVVLSAAPAGLAGTSGFAVDAPPSGQVTDLRIHTIEADDLLPESVDNPLTLLGHGLDGSETFEAVVYDEATMDWVADPLVTLHDPTPIDGSSATVLADLAPGFPVDASRPISIRYRRP